MICPLMSYQNQSGISIDCYDKACAWWVKDVKVDNGYREIKQCAISLLSTMKLAQIAVTAERGNK